MWRHKNHFIRHKNLSINITDKWKLSPPTAFILCTHLQYLTLPWHLVPLENGCGQSAHLSFHFDSTHACNLQILHQIIVF